MKYILEERFILCEAEIDFDPREELDSTDDSFQKPKETDQEPAEPNNKPNAIGSKIDWEAEYKKCKTSEDFEEFWHGSNDPRADKTDPRTLGYYKAVWGENAAHIESLGSTFIKTLIEKGWSAEHNPYVNFLTMVASSKGGLKLKYINKPSFDTIVEAINSRYIQEKDLITGGAFKVYNIIFNPYFYALSSQDQEKIIKIQKNFSLAKNNLGVAFANIYSKQGIKKLDKLETSNIKPGLELLSVRDIETYIKKLGGTTEDKSEVSSEKIAEIIEKCKDAFTCKKMIALLYDLFGGIEGDDFVKSIDSKLNGALTSARKESYPTLAEAKALRDTLGLPNVTYSKKQIIELFTSLTKKISKN